MDLTHLRELQQREYGDPAGFLRELRHIEPAIASSALPSRVKQLRTNSLKHWREARAAALFCYGMGERIGRPILFCPEESKDYDFVATWQENSEQHFAPVQLKEVVPESLNSTADIQSVVDSLKKYVDSGTLTVAIHLNRQGRFEPKALTIPKLNIAALWVFGAVSPDQSSWCLWGNLLEEADAYTYEYPA